MKQFFLRKLAQTKAYVGQKYDKFIERRNSGLNWAVATILAVEPTSDTESLFMIPVAAFFFALAFYINFAL